MTTTNPNWNNTIICVDDEKDIVQAYVDVLSPAAMGTEKRSSRSGASATSGPSSGMATSEYRILRAESGEQALELIRAELAAGRRVAGGFFDVKMDGGIDGIQTLQAAWKLDPDLHATIVTAYQDRSVQDINQLFGERFKAQWDYLNKPFSQGEIVQKARQMVAAWNHLDQLKRTQKQLVQSERLSAIGQVARGVGHEFGNILQRIVGKADLSLNESDSSKVKENLNIIIQAAETASVVVRNLQSFSKGTPQKTATDLSKVIRDTLTLVNHDLKRASVIVDAKVSAVPAFLADSVGLQQILLNLLINAMHAMPKGGKIEVGCELKEKSAKFWVQDSGTGIPPEVLPKIFEYAFTTKGDKGSGLGLSISRQIVEAHGGTISVKTEVGKGTRFEVSIPV